jgi:hypothetical protein
MVLLLTNSVIVNIYLIIIVNVVICFYIWLLNGVIILVNTNGFNKTMTLDKIR